jgi:hypothetical protein
MKKLVTLLSTAAALALAATGAQAGAVPHIGKVFYIAMENHNWTQPLSYAGSQQIFGNSAAPYINSLVTGGNPNSAMVSYASNYVNVSPGNHPSEPNYVWQEAGLAGPLNDNNPYPSNIVAAQNLSNLLQMKKGASGWRSYQEDTDLLNTGGQNFNGAGGTLTNNVAATSQYEVPLASFSGTSASYTNPYNGSNQYNFAAKHDGSLFFTATNGGNDPTSANAESGFYAPMQQLSSDLANNTVAQYNWITPDQYNDMHSSLNTNFVYNGTTYLAHTDAEQIAMGDNFLSIVVPEIMASKAFKQNGEIVIWNDETEGDSTAGSTSGFTSMEIVISPLAKGNAYTNTIQYSHTEDLQTLQDIFHVANTNLGAAAGAGNMSDLYKSGVIPGVPEPSSWAMLIAGVGLVGAAARRRSTKGAAACQ